MTANDSSVSALTKGVRPPVSTRQGSPIKGALWMLATGLCFVGVTAIVRYIGTDVPAPQAAFLRFAFGVVFLAPALARIWRAGIAPAARVLFGWRGVVHVAAVILWFYAMARLPVAEVTAIGYLNPVIMTVGGVLLFGEQFTRRRLALVLVALFGAMIILRPGLRELTDGHLAQLVATVCFAGSYLLAKRLSQLAEATTVVVMLSITATVGLLPFAIWSWVPISLADTALLAGTAVLGTTAHYCMTRAFAEAPMTVTQPVTFLQLVWASLLGVLVFNEAIDPFVLAGAALIISAITLNTWIETRSSRSPAQPLQPDV